VRRTSNIISRVKGCCDDDRAVLAQVPNKGMISASQLQRQLPGYNLDSITNSLEVLVQLGIIVDCGDGLYRVVPEVDICSWRNRRELYGDIPALHGLSWHM
jgi:hypothetical protein